MNKSMTVKQLIKELKKQPQDKIVMYDGVDYTFYIRSVEFEEDIESGNLVVMLKGI